MAYRILQSFQHPTRDSKAAIPSSGLLAATHDYYRCRLGSTARNSPCGTAEYPGEAIPHHPASFPGSPLFCSWLQCWSLQTSRNLPGPPGHDHL
ncbi:pancreatic progenitor cell differentiation and proliferation factor-like [Leptonychotes weddellii]|uniref:Pancreatic progenitor cell differentiation and proliferation factor-like n=1 Tax=Leptonychotes weddellii TaxID=9713 RepID=A0A7F8RNG2_LEPWE|nr:pancreatic progenitor cell differentiation and proliferation factor-like [Leptonychotes weddellii]